MEKIHPDRFRGNGERGGARHQSRSSSYVVHKRGTRGKQNLTVCRDVNSQSCPPPPQPLDTGRPSYRTTMGIHFFSSTSFSYSFLPRPYVCLRAGPGTKARVHVALLPLHLPQFDHSTPTPAVYPARLFLPVSSRNRTRRSGSLFEPTFVPRRYVTRLPRFCDKIPIMPVIPAVYHLRTYNTLGGGQQRRWRFG